MQYCEWINYSSSVAWRKGWEEAFSKLISLHKIEWYWQLINQSITIRNRRSNCRTVSSSWKCVRIHLLVLSRTILHDGLIDCCSHFRWWLGMGRRWSSSCRMYKLLGKWRMRKNTPLFASLLLCIFVCSYRSFFISFILSACLIFWLQWSTSRAHPLLRHARY